MTPPILHRWRHAMASLYCAMLLAACGGAGELGSGGTGAAAEGTVTGYGSIYVDGARFDDSNASVTVDNLDGSEEPAETKLGQRVGIAFTVDAVAQSVKIEPEAIGTVSGFAAGGFTVLGQKVLVNTDPSVGPVTQFDGGYASLADVQPGHWVEVHGARNAADGLSIRATRVERRATAPAYLRVAGAVAGLTSSFGSSRFSLGTLTVDVDSTATVVVPAGRALADGQAVVVFAPLANLQNTTLQATRVRIRERSNGPVRAYLGGVVSNLAGNSFRLGELRVTTSAATEISPPNRSLVSGQYVQVRGNFADDGSVVASEIKLRGGVLDADLRGTAIGYVAATHTFTVRGVDVDAAAVTPVDCPADLSGQYVEVSGRLGLGGVVADTVRCKPAPNDAVIERRGVASNTVPTTNSFTLAPSAGPPITVRWTPLTFFRDVSRTRESLNGAVLRVEGVLNPNTGVLIATKVRLGP